MSAPAVSAARRAVGSIEAVTADLQKAHDELDEYINARSEKWKDGETGQKFAARLEALAGGISDLESAATALGDISQDD